MKFNPVRWSGDNPDVEVYITTLDGGGFKVSAWTSTDLYEKCVATFDEAKKAAEKAPELIIELQDAQGDTERARSSLKRWADE